MADKKQLLSSKEFEEALAEGADAKRELVTTCKQANKSAFQQFSEIMLQANPSVKQILGKRRKNRTDSEVEEVKAFKQRVRDLYYHGQKLIAPEAVEDGKKSRIEKIVEKIVPVIDILRYIGEDALENELKKHGLSVDGRPKLEDQFIVLGKPEIQDIIKQIFIDAKSVKKRVDEGNDAISKQIYEQKVPIELQYDKKTNNTGLKPGDFRKLVDMKLKLDLAKSKEAKEKVDEKIQDQAEEKQFEIARAELVRDGLTKLS